MIACKNSRRQKRLVLALALTLLVFAPIPSALSHNFSGVLETLPATLVAPNYRPSGAVVGDSVYLFGGSHAVTGSTDVIQRFDPVTGSVTLMDAVLPTPVELTGAAAHGGLVYVFGGWSPETGLYSDQILVYDPAADTVSVSPTSLPTPRAWLDAVTVGDRIFVIGGDSASGRLRDILVFTPATGTLSPFGSLMPSGVARGGAVFDGTHVYYTGGSLAFGDPTSAIVRITPGTGAVSTLSTSLPIPLYGHDAVHYDGLIWTFGG